MGSSLEETKQALQHVLELTKALEVAETQDERDRLLEELKGLVMEQLGVQGTA